MQTNAPTDIANKRRRHARITCAAILITALVLPVMQGIAKPDSKKEWTMACRLYKDSKARNIGDLLTVIIEEESSASTDASGSANRSSSMGGSANFTHPNIDGKSTAWTNAALPSYTMDISKSFSGSGSTENSDQLKSKITVRITDILPNGSLIVEGKRSVMIQDETMQVVLTGTVRIKDISKDNTISSTLIADTTIRYKSTGPMTKNQKMGLLTRIWNWINPF